MQSGSPGHPKQQYVSLPSWNLAEVVHELAQVLMIVIAAWIGTARSIAEAGSQSMIGNGLHSGANASERRLAKIRVYNSPPYNTFKNSV
jgi:hypothetical protein